MARERIFRNFAGLTRFGSIANFLTQDSSIIPGKTEAGVGGITPQGSQRLTFLGIIKEKDVSLFALDQCNHIDVL